MNIVRANPLDHAAGIKELFLAHERPEFPEFFDRAYPAAAASGASSWIGSDGDGPPVLHIAVFRKHFALGGDTVVGGMLANLMAARSHRTFLPARALMRRVITDAKADGDFDFLYADPNTPASALLKTVGFEPVGTLRRFALPLGDRRWYVNAATHAYRMLIGFRAQGPRLIAVAHPAQYFDPTPFERPAGSPLALRPFRPVTLYHQRLPGFPSASDRWITFHQRSGAPAIAAALVRMSDDGTARLMCVWRDPSLPMAAIVPPLIQALRGTGSMRLWISTLEETRFAAELRQSGFIPRPDVTPVVALALTERGTSALDAAATWEITDLDCDR